MRKEKEYAIYKGEDCLGIGTKKELAEQMKVQVKTISFYTTPTYKKRCEKSKNRREVIKLED